MLIKTNQTFLEDYQPGEVIARNSDNYPLLTFIGYSCIDGKPIIQVHVINISDLRDFYGTNWLNLLIQQIPQTNRFPEYTLEIQLIEGMEYTILGLDVYTPYVPKMIKFPKLKIYMINNKFKLPKWKRSI